MENEIKDFVTTYYKNIQFENEEISCIKKEYDFGNNNNYKGATIDFLCKTKSGKYMLIECKGNATEGSIGQILKYRTYAKEKFKIEDRNIFMILLANCFHNDFFVAYSTIKHLNLFKPYQCVRYYSFRGDKKFYHVFSIPEKKHYQIIKKTIKDHQQVRDEIIEVIKEKRWKLITSGDLFIIPTHEEIQKLIDSIQF